MVFTETRNCALGCAPGLRALADRRNEKQVAMRLSLWTSRLATIFLCQKKRDSERRSQLHTLRARTLLRREQARTRQRREPAQVHTDPLQGAAGKNARPSTWQLPFRRQAAIR